jgi:hypothetical protein
MNQLKIDNLRDSYQYKTFEGGIVTLLNASELWGLNPEKIFDQTYRVFGTRYDVSIMTDNKTGVEINVDNFSEFQDEVISYRNLLNNSTKISDSGTLSLEDLIILKNGVLPEPTKPKTKRASTFKGRLEELPQDKFLNVSKLKPNGTGSIKINTPGTGSRSLKWTGTLRIASNNLDSYLMALDLLRSFPEEFEQTEKDIRHIFGILSTKLQRDLSKVNVGLSTIESLTSYKFKDVEGTFVPEQSYGHARGKRGRKITDSS